MHKSTSKVLHTNRLAQEKSPYLLQHAHNPVDWYPWGQAAFDRAREENKPILLSVGYSTCHWCHVMERESFEDENVGVFLNKHFISIKVDREERPDLDKIYMTFVQATTGSGGWPMNVFLTPELKPFYGGTYFPPAPAHGRPSFMQLLEQVAAIWATQPDQVRSNAEQVHKQLEQALQGKPDQSTDEPGEEPLFEAGRQLKQMYDIQNGGFGGAPKFPQPGQPELLLCYARHFDDKEAIQMVLQTCDKMAAGGIYDQLGGGFARYSVDSEWLVPHFEKMLYDNAQLLELYLHAYQISGNTRYADTARGIISYVLRDMTHPEGGFYSAEDADSEGHEGKFYCWTRAELKELLSPQELDVAVSCLGITAHGNFTDHSHPKPLQNQNVLSLVRTNLSSNEQELLASAKAKMMKSREKRVRPHLDDKILSSWNGLMLGSLAQASAILQDESFQEAAEKNLQFIQSNLWDSGTKTLYHRWRDGERDNVQLLEDYAFLLNGVLHVYEATLDARDLEFAVTLADEMLARFYDPDHGGFWQAAQTRTDLIYQIKDDYDGAEPSGNSVATHALFRLATLTGQENFRAAAVKTLRFYNNKLERTPLALPRMVQALDFSLQEPCRIIISGAPNSGRTRDLIYAAQSVFQPHKVILGTSGPVDTFARSLSSDEGAVAYVCTGTACQLPTHQPEKIRASLEGK